MRQSYELHVSGFMDRRAETGTEVHRLRHGGREQGFRPDS